MYRQMYSKALRLRTKLLLAKNIQKTSHRTIISSMYQNVKIPNVSLEEYTWENVHKWYNKTALVCAETKRQYTYLDLKNKCNAMCNFLHKYKNENDIETIAIFAPNIPEFAIVALGAVQAGLKVAFINPTLLPKEISKLLSLCDAKMVFTVNESYEAMQEALDETKQPIPTVVIKTKQNEAIPPKAINFDDIMKHNTQEQFEEKFDLNDTIFLFFSSGTTGVPKCVEITKKNVLASLINLNVPSFNFFNNAEGTYQDTTFGILSMSHVYGMIIVLLNALTKGGKVVTIPKFKSNTFNTALEEHQPTVLFVIPSLFQLILSKSDITPDNLLSVRAIISGSANLYSADVDKFLEKTNKRTQVFQLYGLTETTSMSHCQSMNVNFVSNTANIGLLLPSMEAKIISTHVDSTVDLGPDQTGELCLRGPQVMKGYYRNEKATREAIDDQNWFHTGDIGLYDKNGLFYVSGRIKELIKVKGFQVSPSEIEELIKTHPEVEDVAVIGVPHTYFGEVPKAFVVPKSKTDLKPKTVEDFVKKSVASYKQLIGGVDFVDSIPRSATGKILRKLLK